jgi:hypothetical protein
VAKVVAVEPLENYGELRCFLRDGPPRHFACEILREVDGRAWTLRVPTARLDALRALLRQAQRRMYDTEPAEFDEEGMIWLGRERLAEDEELAALFLQQETDIIFAIWKREHLPTGWSWTLEAMFVPVAHVAAACRTLEAASRAGVG